MYTGGSGPTGATLTSTHEILKTTIREGGQTATRQPS